jgi:hypothetical protein
MFAIINRTLFVGFEGSVALLLKKQKMQKSTRSAFCLPSDIEDAIMIQRK